MYTYGYHPSFLISAFRRRIQTHVSEKDTLSFRERTVAIKKRLVFSEFLCTQVFVYRESNL